MRLPFDTPRLHIRMMRPSDVDTVVAYRNDPVVAELQDWSLPYTPEDLEARLAQQTDHTELPVDGTNLAIVQDGVMIGDLYVGFEHEGHIAEIGYTLSAAAQKQGFAQEAAGALVERLFDEQGVRRVFASLSPDNLASMRLLEAIGLVRESTTRLTFQRRDGTWEDDLHYAVTAEEYTAWRGRPTAPPDEVTLVEITEHNSAGFLGLETHWSQRSFVAPMEASFLDALVGGEHDGHPVLPWFRGVLADGEPAGFVMLADVTEHHLDPYLWRLLVDRRHQRRGIGEEVVRQVVERTRAQGADWLYVSWVPDLAGNPEPFYLRLGFVPTGEIDDGEVVARLRVE